MMIKTARRLTTLCLSSALTFGIPGLAHAAANDAALKAFAQGWVDDRNVRADLGV